MAPPLMPSRSTRPCYAAQVTARFASALFGALSTLGCADMLGLGGLTFEQEASGGAASAGGTLGAGGSTGGQTPASGGDGVTLGSGGDKIVPPPPPPPEFTDEYPMTWPADALVVSTWHGFGSGRLDDTGAFWVYDPDAGSLTSYRLDLLEPDLLGETITTFDAGLLYAPEVGGVPWLFAYDQPSGLVAYGPAPSGDETFEVDSQAGSPGWTHLLVAGDPNDPFLIAADSIARLVRIGPANPNAEDPLVTSVTWDSTFTELLPFRQEEQDGLLRLDSVSGEAAFVPIEAGLLGEPVVLTLQALPGWSLATTFPMRGEAGLALYHGEDGSIETYFPDSAGELVVDEQALWRRDLTAIVPVGADGESWAVAYDAATGIADVRELDPLDPVIVVK
jgi:hypothetical protein